MLSWYHNALDVIRSLMEIDMIYSTYIYLFILTLAFLTYFFVSRDRKKLFEVSFRPILVIGCDSGLGFLIVKHLRKLRFPIISTVLKIENIGQLEVELNEIEQSKEIGRYYHDDRDKPPPYLCLKMDVTSHKDIENVSSLIKEFLIRNEFNGLYAVIFCAGIYDLNFFELSISKDEEWKSIFKVNVFGLIDSAKAFLPLLREHNQWLIRHNKVTDKVNFSRLITIGSILGRLGLIGNSLYCSSKAAVKTIIDSISLELKATKVHCVLIEPGAIKDTNLFKDPLDSERLANNLNELKSKNDAYIGYNPNDLEQLYRHFTFWKDLGSSANVVCNRIYQSISETHPSAHNIVGYDTFIWRIIANLPKSMQDNITRFLFQQILNWSFLRTIVRPICHHLDKLYTIVERILC